MESLSLWKSMPFLLMQPNQLCFKLKGRKKKKLKNISELNGITQTFRVTVVSLKIFNKITQ